MNKDNNQNELLDVGKLLRMYWDHFWKIFLWSILGAVIFYLFAFFMVPSQYKSSVELLVSQKSSSQQSQFDQQDATFRAIGTYKDVLTKSVILDPASRELKQNDNYRGGESGLRNAISVSNKENSQVISIKAKDNNPYIAADMANTIATVFSKKITKMLKIDNVAIVSVAKASKKPISPNKINYALMGLVFGLLISLVTYTLQFLLDTRVKSEEFIIDELAMVSLGQVSHIDSKKSYRGLVHTITNEPIYRPRKRV